YSGLIFSVTALGSIVMKDGQASSQDSFDPFQRFVGGVVLVILMMLIYVILKALLGISSTGVPYQGIGIAQPDEVLIDDSLAMGSPDPEGSKPTISPALAVNKFVFLDLDGSFMSEDSISPSRIQGENTIEVAFDDIDESKRWFVQAASFKEQQQADTLIKRLQDGGFDATSVKVGRWFAVRLMPQEDRQKATRQLKQIRRQFGLRGQIKEREPQG
ncbi:MAG: SPOR domain-containing protein, partial [Chloroflexota bacterium]